MPLSSNRVQAHGSETRCVVGCLGAWEIEGSLTHVLPLGQGLLARLHRVGNMGLPLGQVVSLGVVHSVGALPREVGNHEEGVVEVSDLRGEHPGQILSDTSPPRLGVERLLPQQGQPTVRTCFLSSARAPSI